MYNIGRRRYTIWRKTFAQVEAFIRFRKRQNKYLLKYSEEFSDRCTSEEFSELCAMWHTALLITSLASLIRVRAILLAHQ